MSRLSTGIGVVVGGVILGFNIGPEPAYYITAGGIMSLSINWLVNRYF